MKDLKKKQKDIDEQFQKLAEQKQGLLNQVNKIEKESLMLQGEYRLLENLIKEGEEKKPKEEKSRGE